MDELSVSVVIPARDAGCYLEETLASVMGQSLRPSEIVVVSDGSTDDTAAIARRHGATVIETTGVGAAAALNQGIAAATSELIAHFDADDIMLPRKLESQRRPFETDGAEQLGMVSSDLRMFGLSGEERQSFLDRRPIFQQQADRHGRDCVIRLTPTDSATTLGSEHCIDVKGIYRKSAWSRIGGFNGDYRCAYDMDFVWRLSRHYDVAVVTQVLFLGRQHEDNLSGNHELVATECARLFRDMLREPLPTDTRVSLKRRLKNELRDLAFQHRKEGRWIRSAGRYLQAWVA